MNFEEVLNYQQKNDAHLLSPLSLAYIGDCIYELYVRTIIVSNSLAKPNVLHKNAIKFVQAKAQASIIKVILEGLSEEETHIVMRARNAYSPTVPKNADIMDYKYATGFEALIGYLYLKKEYNRLDEILKKSIEIIKNNE